MRLGWDKGKDGPQILEESALGNFVKFSRPPTAFPHTRIVFSFILVPHFTSRSLEKNRIYFYSE
jgi:hypothetical protein